MGCFLVSDQQGAVLIPHIKTIARVFGGNDYRMRKDFGVGRAEETLSWLLLTSACLSRGAQGDVPSQRAPGSNALEYSNFELGVLFCSRLQGDQSTDRLYCWKPAQCSCSHLKHAAGTHRSNSIGTRLIHLPVPFCWRPARYQEDEDETDFCETPYFHEIPKGTATDGRMLITPYGKALADKYNAEDW